MFIDTHTHLYDPGLMEEDETISRALEAGVGKMYMPNCSSETIGPMLELADRYPRHCIPMMGLHPCYVKEDYKKELDIVHHWLKSRPFAAIGEVGIDYHWDRDWDKEQELAFRQQIRWAMEWELPLVIHSRSSLAKCVELVRDEGKGKVTGVFHCFTGSENEAREIIDLGFLLGVGGILTFKNAGLDSVVQQLPLEHMVLETDAPYLAPHPYRGKKNFSHYIPVIAQKLAELKGLSLEEVAEATSRNAKKLFRI